MHNAIHTAGHSTELLTRNGTTNTQQHRSA